MFWMVSKATRSSLLEIVDPCFDGYVLLWSMLQFFLQLFRWYTQWRALLVLTPMFAAASNILSAAHLWLIWTWKLRVSFRSVAWKLISFAFFSCFQYLDWDRNLCILWAASLLRIYAIAFGHRTMLVGYSMKAKVEMTWTLFFGWSSQDLFFGDTWISTLYPHPDSNVTTGCDQGTC